MNFENNLLESVSENQSSLYRTNESPNAHLEGTSNMLIRVHIQNSSNKTPNMAKSPDRNSRNSSMRHIPQFYEIAEPLE